MLAQTHGLAAVIVVERAAGHAGSKRGTESAEAEVVTAWYLDPIPRPGQGCSESGQPNRFLSQINPMSGNWRVFFGASTNSQ